ncbi:dihydrofolate reductase family protein [Algoriphagus terrigena]|uniref:dihydrofolate reductase family protein n=1 Tax=Algoriphagus terrigena TaxID=344884 RepID=UPI00040594AB|nr:dihydrofolate reductase family protein [Algoriphagus terrigena]
MRRVIAAINTTLDGFCDHTAITPDEEIHRHYEDLLDTGDTILYGRITYELMEYWEPMVKNPTGEKSMDDFALAIDRIPKVVFSHTMNNSNRTIGWESARLANRSLEEEVLALKLQPGRDILVGSRSLIIQLIKLHLIDEFQLCVHPVVVGSGMPLFENLTDRTTFKLAKTKTFQSGAVMLYYEPTGG